MNVFVSCSELAVNDGMQRYIRAKERQMLLTSGNERRSRKKSPSASGCPSPGQGSSSAKGPSSYAYLSNCLDSESQTHMLVWLFRKRRCPRRTINFNFGGGACASPSPTFSRLIKEQISCEHARGIRKNVKVVQSTGAFYSLLACKRSLKDARPFLSLLPPGPPFFHSYS